MHVRFRWTFLLTLVAVSLVAAPLAVTAADLGTNTLQIRTAKSAETKDDAAGTLTNPVVRYDRSFAPVMEGLGQSNRNTATVGGDWLATSSGFLRLSRLNESPLYFRAALETTIEKDDVALVHFGTMPMDSVRSALQLANVTPLGEVPNNAIVVTGVDELAAASLARAGATVLAWTPGFFVAPEIGITPVLSAERAANPNLDMQASVFPGTDEGLVISQLESMGASVQNSFNGIISFTIDIDDLRNGLSSLSGMPIRALAEEALIYSVDEDTASGIEIGKFRGGDRPYHEAGIDGSSQIIGMTDTGLSVDAGVFADTASTAGTPGVAHRKVVAYIEAQSVAGSGGTGDLETCDGISGATHGHVVASIAAGNASDIIPDVRVLSGFEPNLSGSATTHAIDGVAAGARVFFIDDQVSAQCSDSEQIEAQDPGTLSASLTASKAAGALVHNFSFAIDGSEASYEIASQDIDEWLTANTDFLVVAAAGNSGTDANSDGNLDFGTVTAPGTSKNALTVGSSGYPNNALDPQNSVEPNIVNNGIGIISRFTGGGNGSGQGPAAVTFAADGGNNWRIKPDVMAPGDETLGNQRMTSPTTCISSDNEWVGSDVECSRLLPGVFEGTSFAAAAASGAAALVHDYYAKGFAPSGVTSISGMELKAHMIASADLMTGNPSWRNQGGQLQLALYTPKHLSTFTPEQGYGRVQLNKLLPLGSEPGTPTYIETELLTLALAGTETRTFTVVNADEEMRCAVSWYDKETTLAGPGEQGNLVRNVDMVVTECGAACGDANDVVYNGNFFTEDTNFDRTLLDIPAEFECSNEPGTACDPGAFDPTADCGDAAATCDIAVDPITEDCNSNGLLDFSEFSLPVSSPAACLGQSKDVNNSNEAVFLSSGQLRQGSTVEVAVTWAGSSEGAPPASITAGLVCTGGIAAVGTPDSVRANKSRFTCADALEVTAIAPNGSTTGAVSGAVTVNSIAADGFTVLDTEQGLSFSSANGNVFQSLATAVVDAASNPPSDNDLVIGVVDGGSINISYGAASASATIRCAPQLAVNNIGRRGTNAGFGITGGCDPRGRIDARAIVIGVIPGSGSAITGDLFLDANEDLNYSMAFTNQEEGAALLDVKASLKACVAGSINPDGTCDENTGISIIDPLQSLGTMPAGKGQVVSFNVHVDAGVAFPEQVEMVFGVSAAKNGLTVANETVIHHTLNVDQWSYPNEDPAISGADYYSTDFPTGGREIRVVAGEYFDPLNPDLAADEWIFQDLTDGSFGGGNASLLGFNAGTGQFDASIANNMPWTFDLTDEGFGARRRFDSDAGDNLELESRNSWQWSNTGECGFQSNDISQADFGDGGIDNKGVGGIWHTGHAETMAGTPGGRTGYDLGCEDYDLPGSADPKRERVIDAVGSPIFFRVHNDVDANGFAYTLQFTRLAFNLQYDIADGNVISGYELDPDTTTSQPVDPLDFGWLASDQGTEGFLSATSQGTYMVFNPNDPHDPTSATALGESLDDTASGQPQNIREIQGFGSPGSFFDAVGGDVNKAPARSYGEITGLLTGRGISLFARRGAGGFPVRNYDNELADGFAGTFEDIFGPNETRDPDQSYPINAGTPESLINQRSSFQANFTMILRENADPSIAALPSYGVGIDDVVVEWREMHPVSDRTPCSDPSTWALSSKDDGRVPVGESTTCTGGANAGLACSSDAECPASTCTSSLASGCAVISWDRSNILSPEDTLVLTVIDTNAQYGPDGLAGTGDEQAVDSNGDGFAELSVPVNSEADITGEILVLQQTALAGAVYQGTIAVSSTKGLTSSTDGTIFIQENGDGTNPTSVNAQYTDQDINVAGLGKDPVPCPDNPLITTALTQFTGTDVAFVTATINDVGPNADGDLIADPGEEIEMGLVLINSTLDVQREKPDLNDVLITLVANSLDVGANRPIACVLDGETFVGDMPSGLPVATSASDPLRWVVGNVSRGSTSEVLQAKFSLGISGRYTDSLNVERPVTSFATPQSFGINLDLDILPGGGLPLASDTACTGGDNAGQACFGASDCPNGSCDALPGYLATGGSSVIAGQVGYFEGFEGAANMAGRNFAGEAIAGTSFAHYPGLNAAGGYLDGGVLDTFQPGPLTPGAAPGNAPDSPEGSSANDGIRCQYNDPRGPSKHGRSESGCRVWDGSDYHVNDTKAFTGTKSLHAGMSGRYDFGIDDSFDANHTNAMQAAFSGTFNVGVSGNATLSIAHIVATADDRTFNVPAGNAAGRGFIEWAEVDPNTGTPVGAWTKVNGFQNNYGNTGVVPFFTNCIFDNYDAFYDASAALGATPGFNLAAQSPVGVNYNADGISSEDDYFDPNDPLRLFGSSGGCFPQFVFASLGDYTSTNTAAVGKAFTEGALGETGNGVWIKSLFNLDAAAGRTIRVRFVLTDIDIAPTLTWADLFGNRLGNATRGWRIDDVAVSGVVDAPIVLAVDTRVPGASTCPVDPDPGTPGNENACGVVTASAGSDVLTPVSGATVTLDASASFADQCVDGHLEYQWRIGGTIVQPFSTSTGLVDAPLFTTEYTVDVRCSTDPECNNSDSALVVPGDQLEASGSPDSLLSATTGACSNDNALACDPGSFNALADCNDAGATCDAGIYYVAEESSVGGPCNLSLLKTDLAGAGGSLRDTPASGSAADLATALRADLCNLSGMAGSTELPGLHSLSVSTTTAVDEVDGYIATGNCQGIVGSLGRLKPLAPGAEAGRGRVNPATVSGC